MVKSVNQTTYLKGRYTDREVIDLISKLPFIKKETGIGLFKIFGKNVQLNLINKDLTGKEINFLFKETKDIFQEMSHHRTPLNFEEFFLNLKRSYKL